MLVEYVRSSGLDPIFALGRAPFLSDAERRRRERMNMVAFERAIAAGAKVLEATDEEDPIMRFGMASPAVFISGDQEALRKPTVGIVGTRSPSTYGKAIAQKFAEALARNGVTVVSGGALGIDACAHEGALLAGGKTVAVLAGGLDEPYPAMNRPLFGRMLASGGCLVSQFALGTKCKDYMFRIRNGCVAAMSDAVLVIEAPGRSGALITAGAAAEFNKSVLVVPGNITHPGYAGSHALIRDGAHLVDHPDQVLEAIGFEPVKKVDEDPLDLEPAQQAILELLAVETLGPEQLIDRLGLASSEVMMHLTEMELAGLIFRDGMGYAKQ